MVAKIITIAQQKGGAGKTTLAAHLAVAWSGLGHRVAVVDIDPQGSLTAWDRLRAEVGPATTLDVRGVSGWRVATEVDRLKRDHAIVLVDSPPHAETEARAAVRAADLVVVPVQPSPMDLWASRATLDMARKEGTPALVVLNRVPPRAKLTQTMQQKIAELGAPVADTVIGNRVALAAAMLEGQGIGEYDPRSRAGQEIEALAREILNFKG
ncbi:MAG: ParA family partition ATPase [Thalassobaculales bacterium]